MFKHKNQKQFYSDYAIKDGQKLNEANLNLFAKRLKKELDDVHNLLSLFGNIDPIEYSSLVDYEDGEIVKYGDKNYICQVACQGIEPTNEKYWLELTSAIIRGQGLSQLKDYLSKFNQEEFDPGELQEGENTTAYHPTTVKFVEERIKWYLKNSVITNSDRLDGHHSDYFATAEQLAEIESKVKVNDLTKFEPYSIPFTSEDLNEITTTPVNNFKSILPIDGFTELYSVIENVSKYDLRFDNSNNKVIAASLDSSATEQTIILCISGPFKGFGCKENDYTNGSISFIITLNNTTNDYSKVDIQSNCSRILTKEEYDEIPEHSEYVNYIIIESHTNEEQLASYLRVFSTESDDKVLLRWSDPKTFRGCRVVYNASEEPRSENDGTLVEEINVYNKYSVSSLIISINASDTGYFKIFYLKSNGTYYNDSRNCIDLSAIEEPLALKVTNLKISDTDTKKKKILKYTDPTDYICTGCKVILKANSIPSDENDGTEIGYYSNTNKTHNIEFELPKSGVIYYVKVFPKIFNGNYANDDDNAIRTQCVTIMGCRTDESVSSYTIDPVRPTFEARFAEKPRYLTISASVKKDTAFQVKTNMPLSDFSINTSGDGKNLEKLSDFVKETRLYSDGTPVLDYTPAENIYIDAELCRKNSDTCGQACIECAANLGAIIFDQTAKYAYIDGNTCTNCELCINDCPASAIKLGKSDVYIEPDKTIETEIKNWTISKNNGTYYLYHKDFYKYIGKIVVNGTTSISWENYSIGEKPLNEYFGITPMVVDENGEKYKLNPDDYTKKLDGTASDITTIGNDVFSKVPRKGFKQYSDAHTFYEYEIIEDFSLSEDIGDNVGSFTVQSIDFVKPSDEWTNPTQIKVTFKSATGLNVESTVEKTYTIDKTFSTAAVANNIKCNKLQYEYQNITSNAGQIGRASVKFTKPFPFEYVIKIPEYATKFEWTSIGYNSTSEPERYHRLKFQYKITDDKNGSQTFTEYGFMPWNIDTIGTKSRFDYDFRKDGKKWYINIKNMVIVTRKQAGRLFKANYVRPYEVTVSDLKNYSWIEPRNTWVDSNRYLYVTWKCSNHYIDYLEYVLDDLPGYETKTWSIMFESGYEKIWSDLEALTFTISDEKYSETDTKYFITSNETEFAKIVISGDKEIPVDTIIRAKINYGYCAKNGSTFGSLLKAVSGVNSLTTGNTAKTTSACIKIGKPHKDADTSLAEISYVTKSYDMNSITKYHYTTTGSNHSNYYPIEREILGIPRYYDYGERSVPNYNQPKTEFALFNIFKKINNYSNVDAIDTTKNNEYTTFYNNIKAQFTDISRPLKESTYYFYNSYNGGNAWTPRSNLALTKDDLVFLKEPQLYKKFNSYELWYKTYKEYNYLKVYATASYNNVTTGMMSRAYNIYKTDADYDPWSFAAPTAGTITSNADDTVNGASKSVTNYVISRDFFEFLKEYYTLIDKNSFLYLLYRSPDQNEYNTYELWWKMKTDGYTATYQIFLTSFKTTYSDYYDEADNTQVNSDENDSANGYGDPVDVCIMSAKNARAIILESDDATLVSGLTKVVYGNKFDETKITSVDLWNELKSKINVDSYEKFYTKLKNFILLFGQLSEGTDYIVDETGSGEYGKTITMLRAFWKTIALSLIESEIFEFFLTDTYTAMPEQYRETYIAKYDAIIKETEQTGELQHIIEPKSQVSIDYNTSSNSILSIEKVVFNLEYVRGKHVFTQFTDSPDDANYDYYAFTFEHNLTESEYQSVKDATLAEKLALVKKEDCDCFYMGSYLGYINSDNAAYSVSGKSPTVYVNISQCRRYSEARGSHYINHNCNQWNFLRGAYLVTFQNRDSQRAIGYGRAWANALASTGGANSFGLNYELTSDSIRTNGWYQAKLFGIEDFWGNLWVYQDGYRTSSNSQELMWANGNYDRVDMFETLGYTGSGNEGYYTNTFGNTKGSFSPAHEGSTSGSDTNSTYSDYWYQAANCVYGVGGYWGDNWITGVFASAINSSVTRQDPYYGFRLARFPKSGDTKISDSESDDSSGE